MKYTHFQVQFSVQMHFVSYSSKAKAQKMHSLLLYLLGFLIIIMQYFNRSESYLGEKILRQYFSNLYDFY